MKAMKIKYVVKSLIIGICFFSGSSCSDSAFDKAKPSNPTEDVYFLEESQFEKAVYGVYAKMNGLYAWNGGREPWESYSDGGGNALGTSIWQLPGDDMQSTGSGHPAVEFETFGSLQPSNRILNAFYIDCYEIIGRANVVLQKNAAVADGIYVTPNLKEYHRGEALFLRAYIYYNLWNFYAIAPLVTKRLEASADAFALPSEGTQLLDQAIVDLQEAATLLPTAWNDINKGRVTKNSAFGMLGKILVFRGMETNNTADYQAAIEAFNSISGASLLTNFGNNFSANDENNAESLFEYQASQSPGDNQWLTNEFDNIVGSMSVSVWIPFEGINSWGYGNASFMSTQKLIDAFDPADPRLPFTVDPATKAIQKYILADAKTGTGGASLNNPRILRYADVLLLKAEATLLSGGSKSEAIGLINQIRARARGAGAVPADLNTGETDEDTIMQWIMDERFRELAFEESHRWFDLKRWHKAGKITLTPEFFDSENTGFNISIPKHLNFPIPLAEIDKNPSMKQNPGY